MLDEGSEYGQPLGLYWILLNECPGKPGVERLRLDPAHQRYGPNFGRQLAEAERNFTPPELGL